MVYYVTGENDISQILVKYISISVKAMKIIKN
jgi:hypothetical protein